MLTMAKAGKFKGYLLEGMGCPGGCVAGAGVIKAPQTTSKLVEKEIKKKSGQTPIDSQYMFMLENLEEREELMNKDFSKNADAWEEKAFS